MTLHQLSSVTLGVPDPEVAVPFYTDFGLKTHGDGVFSSVEGGRQLFLVETPTRRLIEMVVGVDDHDDLARVQGALSAAGHHPDVEDHQLTVVEPITAVRVVLRIASAPRADFDYRRDLQRAGPNRTVRTALAGRVALRSGPAS